MKLIMPNPEVFERGRRKKKTLRRKHGAWRKYGVLKDSTTWQLF